MFGSARVAAFVTMPERCGTAPCAGVIRTSLRAEVARRKPLPEPEPIDRCLPIMSCPIVWWDGIGHDGTVGMTPGARLDTVRTVAELAAALRQVRVRAGNPSLRAIQQWAEDHGRSLPRTTVADMLSGRRLPRLPLLLDFLLACGVPHDRRNDWIEAWSRLVESGGEATKQPADRQPIRREPAGWERDAAAFLQMIRRGWALEAVDRRTKLVQLSDPA
jgi:hypothetical protein